MEYYGKIHHFYWEDYGKLWKITISQGKTMEYYGKIHHFYWENHGKLWKITSFTGKQTHYESPCSTAILT